MNPALCTPELSAIESFLRASGVRVAYGRRTILNYVDVDVRAGQFWFFVGPNGQGKTSLLRALLGRLNPVHGRVTAGGDFSRPERIGFVPQSCSLNPTLPTTVREFVLLGTVGLRLEREQEQSQLAGALAQVGLDGLASRDYWSLSGGQRQRALVARALVRRPCLLIADEPTSGLDMSVEDSLLQSLAQLNAREKMTVIMVTHDLGMAARYGTHVALIHNARVDSGPVDTILRPALLEHAYRVPVSVESDAPGRVHIRIGSGNRCA